MLEKLTRGRWRITKMQSGDRDWVDGRAPALIEWMDHGFGVLQVGPLSVNLDYDMEAPDKIAFSFYGDEQGREVFGRGWVKQDSQGLYGRLLFHEGAQLHFEASLESLVRA